MPFVSFEQWAPRFCSLYRERAVGAGEKRTAGARPAVSACGAEEIRVPRSSSTAVFANVGLVLLVLRRVLILRRVPLIVRAVDALGGSGRHGRGQQGAEKRNLAEVLHGESPFRIGEVRKCPSPLPFK